MYIVSPHITTLFQQSRRLFAGSALLTGIVVFLLSPQITLAQDTTANCVASLSNAEKAYFEGNFEQTIQLLTPCINSTEYTEEQNIQAFSLLGRTHFVFGNTDAARQSIEGLFTVAPEYTPPSQLPPNFVAFIEDVKQDMIAAGTLPSDEPITPIAEETQSDTTQTAILNAPRRKKNRKFLLLGGGAAVAIAGAAILLGGGSSSGGETPTGFPLPPGRQGN